MRKRTWSRTWKSSKSGPANRSPRGRTAIRTIPSAGTSIPNTSCIRWSPRSGRYFVGDFIGEFEPGNLVLTGPNLPHNWVSDIPEGASVPLRCRIIQFGEAFIGGAMEVLPELAALAPLLEASRRGVLFSERHRPSGRSA